MIYYRPETLNYPKTINVVSAWEPMAPIIKDTLTKFKVKQNVALEFGVERGFSTTVLANYFKMVIGVDPFDWIIGDGVTRDYSTITEGLKDFKNIQLIQATFEQFIEKKRARYDLIHVDIGYDTHCYELTYPCGEWAIQHSDCVIFHDTISFEGVMKACIELSEKYGFDFYNYSEEIGPAGITCGLGILIKKQ